MNKEEARIRLEKLNESISSHKNCIDKKEREIIELEAIINKKDDSWRDKLTQPDTTGFYFIDRDEDQGFVVEEEYFSERKPEHAFSRVSQAELIMNKMLLMQEMHAFAHARNEGWMPDWNDGKVGKFGILYNAYDEFEVIGSYWCNYFVFGISVKSMEIADEMFEEFGERIVEVYNKQY